MKQGSFGMLYLLQVYCLFSKTVKKLEMIKKIQSAALTNCIRSYFCRHSVCDWFLDIFGLKPFSLIRKGSVQKANDQLIL